MKKGVIVRHLMLPGHTEDSKKIIKYLYDKYKDNIYISIMNQYTPVNKTEYDNLNTKVKDKDYDELINYALDLGVKNAFIQEGKTCEESFIPKFDLTGIK
jgi:putative pyruvate formate lyase activating enzyme